MSENLICPGLKTYSKQGKENFDKIFRKKIKVSTDRECREEYCSLWKAKGKNCEHLYYVKGIMCCRILY